MMFPPFRQARWIMACFLFQVMSNSWGQTNAQEPSDWMENRPTQTWTDYLPYHQTQELTFCSVQNGSGFWAVRTDHAVFTCHEEEDLIQRISTVQGLSGSQPSALAWDASGEMLLIGNESGAIDFFSNTGEWLYTLNDIAQSNLIGDKSIQALIWGGEFQPDIMYAACGFGVVVIHLRSLDIQDTWYLQGQQNLRRCLGLTKHEEKFVVWTDAGVFEAPADHPFLSSPETWQRWSDIPLETGWYEHVKFLPEERILVHLKTGIANAPDQIWIFDGGLWSEMENWESAQVLDIETGQIGDNPEDWLLAIADHQSIRLFNAALESVQLDYSADGVPLRVRDMEFKHGIESFGNVIQLRFEDLFIANHQQGLLKMDISGGEDDAHWVPSGPPVALVRDIDAWNDRMWIASGGIDETWTSMYHKHGLYGLSGNRWEWLPLGDGLNELQGINDPMCVSIDPTNPDHAYFGTWEEGIIEVLDGAVINIFNDANSSLELADFGGSPRIGVGGMDFDALGNLWFTNAYAEHPLHVRLNDGDFLTLDVGNALGNDGWAGQLLAGRNGYIWVILPRGQGLLVYDTNGTPSDTSDDDWRVLTSDLEEGALPSDDIYSIEEDLDGEIWLGTAAGPCVIYLPSMIFETENQNAIASQILIQQDGNYQLLLETEVIESICIDGGNRKWIGTQNSGVYLLSPDGVNQIHHFTAENSPLLSNQITDIAINHRNGEVLIGTARGLMGWRSDANNFVQEIDAIRVYPNPVRSDFEGVITIDGLAYESTVHITTGSGRLMAQLESEGGRAIWDGRDFDGAPAPFGVYVVFVTNPDGSATGATKLAIVR